MSTYSYGHSTYRTSTCVLEIEPDESMSTEVRKHKFYTTSIMTLKSTPGSKPSAN